MTKKHHKRSSKHHRREKLKRAKIGHQADEAYKQTESPNRDLLKPPPVYPEHKELSDTGDGNSDANHIDKTPRKGFTELIRTLTKFESVSKPNGSSRSEPSETMTGPEDPRQPKEQNDDDIEEYSDSEDDRKLPAASTRPASPLDGSRSSESDNHPEPHEDDLPYEVPNVPHAAGTAAPEPPEPQNSTNKVQLEEMLRTHGFVIANEGEISGIETSPAKDPYEDPPKVERSMDIVDYEDGNLRYRIMFRNSNNRR